MGKKKRGTRGDSVIWRRRNTSRSGRMSGVQGSSGQKRVVFKAHQGKNALEASSDRAYFGTFLVHLSGCCVSKFVSRFAFPFRIRDCAPRCSSLSVLWT